MNSNPAVDSERSYFIFSTAASLTHDCILLVTAVQCRPSTPYQLSEHPMPQAAAQRGERCPPLLAVRDVSRREGQRHSVLF